MNLKYTAASMAELAAILQKRGDKLFERSTRKGARISHREMICLQAEGGGFRSSADIVRNTTIVPALTSHDLPKCGQFGGGE